MNKSELVDHVCKEAGLSQTQASAAVNAILRAVQSELENENKVSLIGFGTFSVKSRKARMGTNPQTGETISIPAAKLPTFKPGKLLKDRVNASLSGGHGSGGGLDD